MAFTEDVKNLCEDFRKLIAGVLIQLAEWIWSPTPAVPAPIVKVSTKKAKKRK